MMGSILELIPGGWLTAGGAALVALIGAAWKAFSMGKNLERAKHDREKVKAHEQEMERLDKASRARTDAEQRADRGELHDEWTRPD